MSCALGEVSEDDSPSGASEDSVEVPVKPIVRFPRKFWLETAQNRTPTTAPLDFSTASPTANITAHHNGDIGCSRPESLSPHSPYYKRPETGPNAPKSKRPCEEEWVPRKALKKEASDSESSPDPLFNSNVLRPSPLLSQYVQPHLLLPPVWAHIARFPYPHLMGNVLTSQMGPVGLVPPPYPIFPFLPPRMPFVPPNVPSSNSCVLQEEKKPKVFGPSHQIDVIRKETQCVSEPEIIPIALPKKNLFSVESLLSPSIEVKTETPSSVSVISVKEVDSASDNSNNIPSDPTSSQSNSNLEIMNNFSKQKQRNYKNMTRERRIEANARERTRVHTISAAFDTLRQSIPAFSHNQKLSKLSVLRIAASYILTLSRLAGNDYSEEGSNPSLEQCVDLTTKTIQLEGKAKKK